MGRNFAHQKSNDFSKSRSYFLIYPEQTQGLYIQYFIFSSSILMPYSIQFQGNPLLQPVHPAAFFPL